MLEHPAPPSNEASATIWRTPLVQLLLQLPGFDLIQLAQGLCGAESPKPTALLVPNAPDMRPTLRQWRVSSDLPKATSVGLDSTGS